MAFSNRTESRDSRVSHAGSEDNMLDMLGERWSQALHRAQLDFRFRKVSPSKQQNQEANGESLCAVGIPIESVAAWGLAK